MIFLKTDDEIELLRQSNLLVGKTLAEVAKLIKPGVTTKELDKVAEEFIREYKSFGGWYISGEISRKTKGAIDAFHAMGKQCKDVSGGFADFYFSVD